MTGGGIGGGIAGGLADHSWGSVIALVVICLIVAGLIWMVERRR